MSAQSDIVNNRINKSYLDMGIKEGYIMYAKFLLISILSLGILFPYAYYKLIQQITEHTIIEGRRVYFVGRIRSVYYIIIMGILALILVLGLEYFLKILITGEMALKLVHMIIAGLTSLIITTVIRTGLWRYRIENTHFEDSESKESLVLLDIIRSAEVSIIKWLIMVGTVTIAYPYLYYLLADYYTNRSQIDGEKLIFTGRRRDIYKIFFINLLFTIITAGIMLPRLMFVLEKWKVSNFHLYDTEGVYGRKPTWLERMLDDKVDKLITAILEKIIIGK